MATEEKTETSRKIRDIREDFHAARIVDEHDTVAHARGMLARTTDQMRQEKAMKKVEQLAEAAKSISDNL